MKFPKLVIEEAANLKKFAKKEEIERLNFKELDHDSKYQCIYGQMTGNCFSKRAKELIEKSCRRVYSTKGYLADAKLNGTPVGKYRLIDDDNRKPEWGVSKTDYWSPIEVFIAKEDDDANKKLIQFIKGEIETL